MALEEGQVIIQVRKKMGPKGGVDIVRSYSQLEMRKHPMQSRISHMAHLNALGPAAPFKLSGLLATIGPSCCSVKKIKLMIEKGMNIARLNLAFGTKERNKALLQNVRQATLNINTQSKFQTLVAVAVDIQGPVVRIGYFAGGPQAAIKLVPGSKVTLTTDSKLKDNGTEELIFVDYEDFPNSVELGQQVCINEGRLILVIETIDDTTVTCTVITGGRLSGGKKIYSPGIYAHRPDITQRDLKDIEFALNENVDCIIVSLTMSADTILKVKNVTDSLTKNVLVIAKIEERTGLKNLAEIINVADGILIERGQLSVGLPFEQVFLYQKSMIAQCNTAGKACIVATGMLTSMLHRPRPTRAETTDIANAIIDGADCVLLSEETAVGDYPIECVQLMSNICREAEWACWQTSLSNDLMHSAMPPVDQTHAIAISSIYSAVNSLASAIIVLTRTGRSAVLMSRYYPPCPVIVVTRNQEVARELNFYRCLQPLYYDVPRNDDWTTDIEERFNYAIRYAKMNNLVEVKDHIVLVAGWKLGSGFTNTMRVGIVPETV